MKSDYKLVLRVLYHAVSFSIGSPGCRRDHSSAAHPSRISTRLNCFPARWSPKERHGPVNWYHQSRCSGLDKMQMRVRHSPSATLTKLKFPVMAERHCELYWK